MNILKNKILILLLLAGGALCATPAQQKKRVLIGTPVKQKPEILKEFLQSLEELHYERYTADYCFIDDNDNPESSQILTDFLGRHPENCTLIRNGAAPSEEYICNEQTHYWSEAIIWKVAAFKDHIIEYALYKNYDYLFLIDSDIVLNPKTLDHLVTLEKDIISNIFWTQWHPESPKLPQVWYYDEYKQYYLHSPRESISQEEGLKRMQAFVNLMATPGTYEVGGLGACTLISKNALEEGINFKKIKNITFWGEDRHFCVRAAALGIPLFVDTHYPAFHIYRLSDLENVAQYKECCRQNIYVL